MQLIGLTEVLLSGLSIGMFLDSSTLSRCEVFLKNITKVNRLLELFAKMRNQLLLSLIMFVSACLPSGKNEYDIFGRVKRFDYSTFPKCVRLKGEAVGPVGLFVWPTNIYIKDSLLIVIDRKTKKATMHLFALPSMDYVSASGIRGKEPGELITPWDIHVNKDNSFYVLDATKDELILFEIDSIRVSGRYRPQIFVRLPEDEVYYSFVKLGNGSFVSTGFFQDRESRLMSIHSDGSIRRFGNYPLKAEERIPDFAQAIAYESIVKTNWDEDLIVLAAANCDLLNVFDADGDEIVTIVGPDNVRPDFTYDLNRCVIKEKNIQGYVDLKVTGEFIYGLYSGNRKRDENGDFGRNIFVFDLDGNPKAWLELDRYIISFSVDEENKKIYASSFSGKQPLVVYDF